MQPGDALEREETTISQETASRDAPEPAMPPDRTPVAALSTASTASTKSSHDLRSRIARIGGFVTKLAMLSLVGYYVYFFAEIAEFVAQHGFESLTGREILEFLLIDQISALASRNPLLGAIILGAVLILTGLVVRAIIAAPLRAVASGGELPVAPEGIPPVPVLPASLTEQRAQQIHQWLEKDPLLRALVSLMLGEQLVPLMKRAMHEELQVFARQQRLGSLISNGLTLLSILPPIIGLIAGLAHAAS